MLTSGKHIMMANLVALIVLIVALTPSSSQQVGTYDPWLDYNEDGIIDVNDLHPLAQTYGTSGDPTRTVNIRHNYYECAIIGSAPWPLGYWQITNRTAGYRQVTYRIRNFSPYSDVNVTAAFSISGGSITWTENFQVNKNTNATRTYDVEGSLLTITITAQNEWNYFEVVIYMTT